jgi:hypothetical protein
MRWAVIAAMATACGRIAFEPATDAGATGADAPSACQFDDDFESGVASWQGPLTLEAGRGAGASTGYGSLVNTPLVGVLASHPLLVGFDAVDISVDYNIDVAIADFGVLLLKPGWVDHNSDGYEVGLFPTGGDNASDVIVKHISSVGSGLATHALSRPVRTWTRVRVVRTTDGTIDVTLDGAPYMTTTDTTLSPPFEVAFRVFDPAFLDNVRVRCP